MEVRICSYGMRIKRKPLRPLSDIDSRNRKKPLNTEAMNTHRGNVQNWTPIVLEDVQANPSVRIYVRVEKLGNKLHQWSFFRVVFGKHKHQLESATLPCGVIRSEDDSVPFHNIVLAWCATNSSGRVLLQDLEVPNQTPTCRSRHGWSTQTIKRNNTPLKKKKHRAKSALGKFPFSAPTGFPQNRKTRSTQTPDSNNPQIVDNNLPTPQAPPKRDKNHKG
mmetsp:Transcript_843/g.2122  ORF Transcript_843/g.2122 Transcript_843/m.2122 type:complete len:220 (-) Transcript_843:131-790(-)